MNKSEAICAQ